LGKSGGTGRAIPFTVLASYSELIEDGIIPRQVALLDPNKVSAGVNVFVSIRTNQHSLEWASKFCRAAAQIPKVVEFYRMSGRVDYLLRVVVRNIATHDEVYKKLIKAADLYDVTSSFAMGDNQVHHCVVALFRERTFLRLLGGAHNVAAVQLEVTESQLEQCQWHV
jgi:DNA-binding Lrp family transcriptional regulator